MIPISILFFLVMTPNLLLSSRKITIIVSEKWKINLVLFSTILTIALFSGLRSSIGDTGYYMYSYTILPNDLADLVKMNEVGFQFFQYTIKYFFVHPQWLLIISSVIIVYLILKTVDRYSYSFPFSLFLLFANSTLVSSMNGLRQYLAASILFYAVKYVMNKDFKKYLLFTLVAMTIHSSAVLMIPFYFIANSDPFKKGKTFIYILLLFSFIAYNNLLPVIGLILSKTQYQQYATVFGTESYQGASIIRVLEAFLPVFLLYRYRSYLKRKIDHYDIFANFSIINFLIMLFSYHSWLFSRLSIYFTLYNLILIPNIYAVLFKSRKRSVVFFLTIVFYLMFFIFSTKPHIYSSYYLNINRESIGPLTRTFYNLFE